MGCMTASVHDFDAHAEDPVQRQLDGVREAGPRALAELLGDQSFLLAELAAEPGAIFGAAEYEPQHYAAVLGRLHEQRAAMDALEARAVVDLADAFRREARAEALADAAQDSDTAIPVEETDEQSERTAARELSMITRRSPAAAGRSVGSCRRLVESMPQMFHALLSGKVAADVVHSTANSLAPLAPEQREEVDRHLGDRLPTLDAAGRKRWKREIAGLIEAVDPGGERKRHQHARTRRHVTVRPGEHGMATVSARLPALDAAKIGKRLSLEAEQLRAHGDRRGHQAIQADSFTATLLGHEGGMDATDLDIGVIITDRALFTPSRGDIAQIEGYGPVPSESIREELRSVLSNRKNDMDTALGDDGPAARATLRRLYTHPTTGELVAVESIARAFPRALARFVLWRDMTCRGPFCDAPIRQTDHIRPYAAGGHTCLDNGEGLCGFCNDKEQQIRSVERETDPNVPGHRVTWTSRTGVTRTTTPDALTRPDSRGRADARDAGDATEGTPVGTHEARGPDNDAGPGRRPPRETGARPDDGAARRLRSSAANVSRRWRGAGRSTTTTGRAGGLHQEGRSSTTGRPSTSGRPSTTGRTRPPRRSGRSAEADRPRSHGRHRE